MAHKTIAAGVAVALVCQVAACAHDDLAQTQLLPPQTIGRKGMVTAIDFGKLEAIPFTLLTSLQVGPQDGKVVVCGASQLLGSTDLTPFIRDGFLYNKSRLTLTQEGNGAEVTLSPAFLPVTYRQAADGTFNVTEVGTPEGNCVLTDRPWDEKWSNPKFHAKLTFYMRRDLRDRTQTVVGAPEARK